jgi:hypothetical protein
VVEDVTDKGVLEGVAGVLGTGGVVGVACSIESNTQHQHPNSGGVLLPHPAFVLRVAELHGWPEVVVDLGDRSLTVGRSAAGWRAFVAWAIARPPALVAVFEALERYEESEEPDRAS